MVMLNDGFGHLFYDVAGDGSPVVLVHAGIAAHLIAMDAPAELGAVLGAFLAVS